MVKAYSDRKVSTLLENAFIFVLLCMIQKLCVDKKWIPPGLSIEILRYQQKKQYMCQLTNFRAQKETFFEPQTTNKTNPHTQTIAATRTHTQGRQSLQAAQGLGVRGQAAHGAPAAHHPAPDDSGARAPAARVREREERRPAGRRAHHQLPPPPQPPPGFFIIILFSFCVTNVSCVPSLFLSCFLNNRSHPPLNCYFLLFTFLSKF